MMAEMVKDQIVAGRLSASQGSWSELLNFIDSKSNSVVSVDFLTMWG
jgi:serine carboxypeptidase 1